MTFRELMVWMIEYESLDRVKAGRILRRILALLTRRPYRRLPSGEEREVQDNQ